MLQKKNESEQALPYLTDGNIFDKILGFFCNIFYLCIKKFY
jgi:hypothetical protein